MVMSGGQLVQQAVLPQTIDPKLAPPPPPGQNPLNNLPSGFIPKQTFQEMQQAMMGSVELPNLDDISVMPAPIAAPRVDLHHSDLWYAQLDAVKIEPLCKGYCGWLILTGECDHGDYRCKRGLHDPPAEVVAAGRQAAKKVTSDLPQLLAKADPTHMGQTKTDECKYFHSRGGCQRGEECHFAHTGRGRAGGRGGGGRTSMRMLIPAK